MEKIYITGLGVISCKGNEVEEFWNNINAVDKHNPAEIKLPLEIPKIINNNVARRMDRFSYMTLVTSKLAMENSSLNGIEFDPFRIGTVFTTGYGPLNTNLSFGSKLGSGGVDLVSPTVFAGTSYNAGVGHTCINLKLKGASTMLVGSNNIAYSCDLLHSGKADAILSGGIEEYCSELEECFSSMEYITQNTDFICRPLDINRDGSRIIEGAAVLVLEKESAPFLNSQKIMCEILGYGSTIDYSNTGRALAGTDSEAYVNAMTVALEDSKINKDQIDCIFMAANGGVTGDLVEAEAIREVFGKKAEHIAVTSI